jgi:hypothetical protein
LDGLYKIHNYMQDLELEQIKKNLPELDGKAVRDGDMVYYYPEMSEIREKIFPVLWENGYYINQTQSSRVDNGNTIVKVGTYIGKEDNEPIVKTMNEVVVYKDSKLTGLQSFGATITYVSRVALVFALGLKVKEHNNKPILNSFGKEFTDIVKAVSSGATREEVETHYSVSDEVWSKILIQS